MFSIRIGDTRFEIYPLLDANEVIMKLHEVMRILIKGRYYKTFIANIERYDKSNNELIKKQNLTCTYTLIILKSPRYLKPKDIAILFKEMFKKRKYGGLPYGY